MAIAAATDLPPHLSEHWRPKDRWTVDKVDELNLEHLDIAEYLPLTGSWRDDAKQSRPEPILRIRGG
ncbi:MAG: hypothetical protein ACR2QQ_03580 [Gammaproteobacteria bacterium]